MNYDELTTYQEASFLRLAERIDRVEKKLLEKINVLTDIVNFDRENFVQFLDNFGEKPEPPKNESDYEINEYISQLEDQVSLLKDNVKWYKKQNENLRKIIEEEGIYVKKD